jgi:hypothetical protein
MSKRQRVPRSRTIEHHKENDMKKFILALGVVTSLAFAGPALAKVDFDSYPLQFAQAATTAKDATTSVQTSAPVTTTTVVKGGDLAASLIEWLKVAFGTTIGAAVLWGITKALQLMGIKATDLQKAQLQAIVVNGLNAGAAKLQTSLRDNRALDITSKSQIVNEALAYTQAHGAETIRALGLDPKSGDAVEAIKARIETALNDPNTPTPPAITPDSGKSKGAA